MTFFSRMGLKEVLDQYELFTDRNTRDYWEKGSHAKVFYPTQDTTCIETVKVKQKEEAEARIIAGK